MFYISNVRVEGFWGKYTAQTNFYKDVNILIGKNGTGKTTFMDLLQAVLRVDPVLLYALEFATINIVLKDGRKQRTISVTKNSESDRPYDVATYHVGNKSYQLPLHPRELERYRFTRLPIKAVESFNEVKQAIDSIVNVASLSVHRISHDELYEEDEPYSRNRRVSPVPVVDKRIDKLANDLKLYQLSLAEQEKEVSSVFQKEVLASMLFDKNFDVIDISEAAKTELGKEKSQLTRAFLELNALDGSVSEKIGEHFSALDKSVKSVKKWRAQRNEDLRERAVLDLEALIPLPLLKRTRHIINLSLKAEKQKQEISKPIAEFLNSASEFMNDKRLFIDSSTGTLIISKDDEVIPLLELSSGEKQLLILLIETLLQRSRFFIFLADEPEISLHIEWQEKIISSIRKLNPSSQIIVATHSPEIAGGWKDYIIDMGDIVHG